MSKYIDSEKLITEIKRRIELLENGTGHPEVMKRVEGVMSAYNSILRFIDSHQQEQLEDEIKREWYNKGYLKGRQEAHIPARELGLPKVFDFKPLDEDFERDAVSFCFDNGLNTTPHIAKTIAHHFYELGLKERKEE